MPLILISLDFRKEFPAIFKKSCISSPAGFCVGFLLTVFVQFLVSPLGAKRCSAVNGASKKDTSPRDCTLQHSDHLRISPRNVAGEASHMTGRIITFRYRSESARADSTSPPPVTGRGSRHDATKRQKDPSSQNRRDDPVEEPQAQKSGGEVRFGWKAVNQTNVPPPSSPPQSREKNRVVSPGREGGHPGGGGADDAMLLRPGTSMR